MPVRRKKAKRKSVRSKVKRVRRSHSKRIPRKVKKRATKKRSVSTVAHLLSRIRGKLNDRLKDLLFLRDKATTRKAHRSAQRQITAVRSKLRKL